MKASVGYVPLTISGKICEGVRLRFEFSKRDRHSLPAHYEQVRFSHLHALYTQKHVIYTFLTRFVFQCA
jgi:hypothetical protein